MRLAPLVVVVMAAVMLEAHDVVSMRQALDPLGFLAGTVSISANERRTLDAGQPVLRTLDGEAGELVVFGAVRFAAGGDRLVSWTRRIEALKKNARVPAIARFSALPSLDDLAHLELGADELADLRACRPAQCALKLSTDEIALTQRGVLAGPSGDAAVQRAFREVVLARVRRYLAGDAVLSVALQPMLDRSPFLGSSAPSLGPFLRQFPSRSSEGIESFLYWSHEALGAKPIVSATHVAIVRPERPSAPEVIVAGRQFFATHYIDGALNLTMVTRSAVGGARYLVFLNRSHVDVLGGFLGGVKRWAVERKLRSDGQEILVGLRRRLEAGEP
jgi:hypothetical protein